MSKKTKMVRRYGTRVIALHWLFIVTFVPMLIAGIFLLRDWFIHEFKIKGGDVNGGPYIPTFEGASELHMWAGILVLILGLVHLIIHMFQKEKNIIPWHSHKDFQATLHTLLFVFHLTRREERGSPGKYRGNQKIAYMAAVYTLTLTAITVLIVWLDLLGEEMGMIMHVVAGILVGLVAGYRILYIIRKHDRIALKCILASGRMPEWYVRKHHYLWYKKVIAGHSLASGIEVHKLTTPVPNLDTPEEAEL
jgi:cytochrome b subunit of formate dehydrogenase